MQACDSFTLVPGQTHSAASPPPYDSLFHAHGPDTNDHYPPSYQEAVHSNGYI